MNLLPDWLKPVAGAYLVGGCVRDLLLGRMPTDYDVVFLGDAPGYARALAASLGGRVVEIGKPAFRIWRVVAGRQVVDVAPAAGGLIAEDLRRRDFTINALAIHTATGEILDVTGGREDLANRTIRMTSSAAFRADPIRLLRAFRFASRLGFAIESQTCATICRDAHLIGASAGERIREELFKLLAAVAAHAQVTAMRQAGLLSVVFPGLEPDQSEQSLSGLQALEAILEDFASVPPDLAECLAEEFPEHRRVLLKCAVLLHPLDRDPATGADRLAAALNRLRLSNRDAARLGALIRQLGLGREFLADPLVSSATEGHFFRAAADLAPDLLVLATALRSAGTALPAQMPRSAPAQLIQSLRNYLYSYRPRALAPPPVTGEDLIREFGLRPSRRFREILDRIEEQRLLRKSFNRAEALELVRAYLDTPP